MSENYSQSDPLTGEPFDNFETLVEKSFDSLHRIHNDSLATAERLATITESERAHRFRFDVTNMHMISTARRAIEESDGTHSHAEIAMDALHNYLTENYSHAEHLHRALGHKGIGLTLGYVEQNGAWESITPLDDSFRKFPDSELLRDKGFRFSSTYGSKDGARLSYGLKIHPTPQGMSLVGIRKRAAADITDEKVSYDIVKRSAFLIDPKRLSSEELSMAGKILAARHGNAPADVGVERQFGEHVLEPYITDQNGVRTSGIVLPAASSYTALRRFDK